jgi:hypothetical protein
MQFALETMTETATTDRFVIEVSRVGTVDHIVDLEADPASGPSYSSRRELPGEKLCDRSTRSPASEYITLRDYADWKGFDKMGFEGRGPQCRGHIRQLLAKLHPIPDVLPDSR